MNSSDSHECQATDNTQGDMGSVTVWVNGEVPKLGFGVGRSGVSHSGMSARERATASVARKEGRVGWQDGFGTHQSERE